MRERKKGKKEAPCIIQRNRQLWHSCESGIGGLLGVKIQFPQGTHSTQGKMPLPPNNIMQSCEKITTANGKYKAVVLYWRIIGELFFSASVCSSPGFLFQS